MKKINVSTWETRRAEAELDDFGSGSDSRIFVRVEKPGESNDPAAIQLVIRVSDGPGLLDGGPQEMQVDLRGPDFRSLLTVLERAIETAEESGILPKAGEEVRTLASADT